MTRKNCQQQSSQSALMHKVPDPFQTYLGLIHCIVPLTDCLLLRTRAPLTQEKHATQTVTKTKIMTKLIAILIVLYIFCRQNVYSGNVVTAEKNSFQMENEMRREIREWLEEFHSPYQQDIRHLKAVVEAQQSQIQHLQKHVQTQQDLNSALLMQSQKL